MPRFLITFNHIVGAWDRLSDGERAELSEFHRRFVEELREEQGTSLVFFAPPTATQMVRRGADGRVTTSEGPDATTEEFAGGYYVVEVDSMDEAVEWAKRGRWMVGSNVVREIVEPEF